SVYPSRTFFFQAEDGIRDRNVTGVQTCALPILISSSVASLTRSSKRFPTTTRRMDSTSASRAVSYPSHARTPGGGGRTVATEDRSEERRVGKGGRGREPRYVDRERDRKPTEGCK